MAGEDRGPLIASFDGGTWRNDYYQAATDPNRVLKKAGVRNVFPRCGCWVGPDHAQADLTAASPVRPPAVLAALRDCRQPSSA